MPDTAIFHQKKHVKCKQGYSLYNQDQRVRVGNLCVEETAITDNDSTKSYKILFSESEDEREELYSICS